jgi:tetratricopeptide (TPR) repeat protein
MRHYYYSDNEEQLGPFTLDELKEKRIKKSTLVWTDGLKDWTTADKVDELKEIVFSEPPPLPKKEINKDLNLVWNEPTVTPRINAKYDYSYQKETDATGIGIIVLIILLTLVVVKPFSFDNEYSYNQFRQIAAILDIVFRIAATIKVVNIAKRQNRNNTNWGWFAFFLPTFALIIIGQLRKLKLIIEIDGNLSKGEQVKTLITKANELYSGNRIKEAVEVVNKAIELDNQNYQAVLIRAKSLFKLEEYNKAINDFEVLKEAEEFLDQVYLHLGIIESINCNYVKAIDLWKIAEENESTHARIYLDRYVNYKGKYLLNQNEINKKLGCEETFNEIEFSRQYLNYLNGISTADDIPQIDRYKTEFILHEFGFRFKLSKLFKSYEFAISYTEISTIKMEGTILNFGLSDNTVISFRYESKNDTIGKLERIYKNFTHKTGIEVTNH